MTIDTSREAIDRMTGLWGVGVEPNMARVTEVLTALTRERDEALADIARIQEERAEFVAGVGALAGVLKGERDDALAREAALREALAGHAIITMIDHRFPTSIMCDECGATWMEADGPNHKPDCIFISTATAAAARDARVRAEGRREGIEEVALWHEKRAADEDGQTRPDEHVNVGMMRRIRCDWRREDAAAIRALATPPAKNAEIARIRAEVERLTGELAAQTSDTTEALEALAVEMADRAALAQRVAELEAGQAWRPIETAPKDGAQFIAINKYGDMTYPIKWDVDRQMWVEYGLDGFDTMDWIRAERLDQWMPIPEPQPR